MNDDKNRRCFFYQEFGDMCGILDGVQCQGINPKCKFFKTKKQYYSDRNDSIVKCREKGLCDDCKYSAKPCELFKV